MFASAGPHEPVDIPPTPASGAGDVVEYEKILNIRDQIFSGTHPRLKLPDQVIRKITPRSVQTPSLPNSHAPASEYAAGPHHKQSPLRPASQAASSPNISTGSAAAKPANESPSGDRVSTTKQTSEIDPIFLTKSDDLIRAEIQLQRQRIERGLREQLDRGKLDAKHKPLPQESRPDFDVSEVLAKALEIAKPPSASDSERANGNVAPSDSFDENSFYSSKAPDSPQNSGHGEKSPIQQQTQPMDINDGDTTVIVERPNGEVGDANFAGRNMLNLQEHAPRFDQLANKGDAMRVPENTVTREASPNHRNIPPEPYEEPEYSPPGPNLPMGGRRDTLPHAPQPEPNYPPGRSYRRPSYVERAPQQQQRSPASRDIRVVRNHITSPAAPQPSRVSPLAVTKVPSLPQSRHSRRGRQAALVSGEQGSGRTSPEGPTQQPLVPRKRRRIQEGQNKRRHTEGRRPGESPEIPYIKPEPVSPPPFTDAPVPHFPKRRPLQEPLAFVDLDSPQYTPVDDRREVGARGAVYDRYGKAYELENPMDVSIPRPSSKVNYRRAVHEEPDLRRVASLQHARQPEYVHDYPEPASDIAPRYLRAASYADRPVSTAKPRYYDEQPTVPYSRRYISGPASPPRYREGYTEIQPEPQAMGPPQRRVVVDADGNRYYETVNPRMTQPPPPTQFSRSLPYDGAAAGQEGRVRAVSIVDDPYRERRYVQEMPPPEIAYRRPSGYTRGPPPPERHIYDREIDERASVMRSGSVQVADYPHRQATYVEEPPYPREEVVRIQSVRPPPSRYEEPVEPQQRPHMQSVRPGRREVSVYIDDEGPRHAREYAPIDRVSYNPVRPIRDERLYDHEDVARMEPESGPDMVRRVSRRY